MDVLTAIKGRRSIRRFRDQAIEEEKIEALKEALVWAPSAGNLQKRKFYFVFKKEIKDLLAEAALNQTFIAEAPLVVVACADLTIEEYYGRRGADLYCVQDTACSIENMMLLAYSLGLGSVWVGAFYEDEVSDRLDLPRHLRPIAIVPVGYPAHTHTAPRRVPTKEAVIEVK